MYHGSLGEDHLLFRATWDISPCGKCGVPYQCSKTDVCLEYTGEDARRETFKFQYFPLVLLQPQAALATLHTPHV